MVTRVTLPQDFLPSKPRPLLKVCHDTFYNLLATVAATNAHPIEYAIVAADLRSKTLLLAVLLPDRFEALRASSSVESNGVDYPIIAVVEPPGKIRLKCEDREWVKLFTPDGRALRAEPKVKDEIVFRRMELLRCLAEMRREERKRRRERRKVIEAERSNCNIDDDIYGDADGTGVNEQARKRKKLREKDRRQRTRRREEAERASELKQLEQEVIQDGVTLDELSRGFRLVEVGSEVYLDELAQAKKLGLKVVRL